jgi:hypothetical protein
MAMATTRRVLVLVAAALLITLAWTPAAQAHYGSNCSHRTHNYTYDGVSHRDVFVRHAGGLHVNKSQHLRWTGTGYGVIDTFRGPPELCGHHMRY